MTASTSVDAGPPAEITVRDLSLELPIYSAESRSFKRSLLSLETGGKLLSGRHGPVRVRALNKVSFTLAQGERLGLLGHNGAGKTTLLRTLAGVYPPTQGVVEVKGDIATMFDIGLGMDPEATGRENIFMLAFARGLSPELVKSRIEQIAEFSGLGPFLDLPVKTYSSGMTGRLSFAVATSFQPDILLMDEWISTGDSEFVVKAERRLVELLEASRLMVFASHSVDLIKSTCTRFIILSHGEIVAGGAIADLDEALASTNAEAAGAAEGRG